MEPALTIFRVGVGIGALLVGIGVILAVLAMRPVAREARALARDARRLVRQTEDELPAILAHARDLSSNAEELSEDVALVLARLDAAADALEAGGRPSARPLQSGDPREDGRIA